MKNFISFLLFALLFAMPLDSFCDTVSQSPIAEHSVCKKDSTNYLFYNNIESFTEKAKLEVINEIKTGKEVYRKEVISNAVSLILVFIIFVAISICGFYYAIEKRIETDDRTGKTTVFYEFEDSDNHLRFIAFVIGILAGVVAFVTLPFCICSLTEAIYNSNSLYYSTLGEILKK